MLRRQSTKSKSDLHRRKSASSVRSVPLEHIDATVAQQHAQIAAAEAFTRRRDRSSTEMSLFPPPLASSPRRPEASTPGLSRSDSATLHDEGTGSCEIRRQQSIRFVGPCSNNSRIRGLGRLRNPRREGTDNASIELSSPIQNSRGGSPAVKVLPKTQNLQPRPLPRGKEADPVLSGLAGSYLNALAAGDEYYTPVDDIASAPSSYRRLRRSQSMFTPGQSAESTFIDETAPFHLNNSSPSRHRLPQSSTTPGLVGSNANKENRQPESQPDRLSVRQNP